MKPKGGVTFDSTGSMVTGTSTVVFGATGRNMAFEIAGANALKEAVPLNDSLAPASSNAVMVYVMRGFAGEIPRSDASTGISTMEPSLGASTRNSSKKSPVFRLYRYEPI